MPSNYLEVIPRSNIAHLTEADRWSRSRQTKDHNWIKGISDVAGALTFATVLTFGGQTGAAGPDVTPGNSSSAVPSPGVGLIKSESSPEDILALAAQKELENKYGINIYTVEQIKNEKLVDGADSWLDTTDNLDLDQIKLLDKLLSYYPPSFLAPIDGKKFGIVIRGSDFGYGGQEYPGTGIIAIHKSAINLDDPEGTMSIITHERAHVVDDLTHKFLWPKVQAILGDESFLRLKDRSLMNRRASTLHKLNELRVGGLSTDIKSDALLTLGSFVPGQQFIEGIAGFAQLYVLNDERGFLIALGPLLDGLGYEHLKLKDFRGNLAEKYPTAQALYNLYKDNVFDGHKFSRNLFDNFSFVPPGLK